MQQQQRQQKIVHTKTKQVAKHAEELHKCCKSHFTRHEIEGLLYIYSQLPQTDTKLDRATMKDVLQSNFQLTEDILMERVFKAFDENADGSVDMKEWIMGMSVYLRGDTREKIKFCFDSYDLNGDGVISREEMFQFLKNSFTKLSSDEDPEEHHRELVELSMKLMDFDRDGRVTLQDYTDSVTREPLLVEILGNVFPDDKNNTAFQTLFTDSPWHQNWT